VSDRDWLRTLQMCVAGHHPIRMCLRLNRKTVCDARDQVHRLSRDGPAVEA
jgi:hypothetical protein